MVATREGGQKVEGCEGLQGPKGTQTSEKKNVLPLGWVREDEEENKKEEV
jgi:hypothetical protein